LPLGTPLIQSSLIQTNRNQKGLVHTMPVTEARPFLQYSGNYWFFSCQ